MFQWLRPNAPRARAATKLYGSVVAAAREPVFYAAHGVPDTAEGRYEMVVIHLVALIERLRLVEGNASGTATQLSRDVTSRFVTDMDDNFREMGVGDLSVPRKVKKAAAALYDRTLQYRRHIAQNDRDGLAAAIAQHVWQHQKDTPEATAEGALPDELPADANPIAIADHLMAVTRKLAAQSDDDVLAGNAAFATA